MIKQFSIKTFAFLVSLFFALYPIPYTLYPVSAQPACSANATACGQDVYDQKTAGCEGTKAIYTSVQSTNPNCQGKIYCPGEDSRCAQAPAACAGTATVCGQSVYDKYTPACEGSKAIYTSVQSTNPNCTGKIYCPGEDSRCSQAKVCTPNEVVGVPECRKCNSAGTGYYSDRGKDYPGAQSSAGWCACAKIYSDATFYKTYCEKTDTNTPAVSDDGADCEYKIMDPKTRKQTYLISGQEYVIQVTTKNTGKTTWKAGSYKLALSESTKSEWSAQDITVDRDVVPNASKIFDVKVKAPQTEGDQHRRSSFYMQMNSGTAGFGKACEPQDIDITPPPPPVTTPTPTPGPVSTGCFVMSENLSEVNSVTVCDFNNPLVRAYTQHPLNTNYIFKDATPGLKNLYVKFLDNENNPSNQGVPFTKTVLLSPPPKITSINCKYTANEIGTTITVNGENFASQGSGNVKVGDSQAQISSWNNTGITLTVPQRLESATKVTVTFDDGKTLSDTCLVNTTTFTFTAKNQCSKDNDFSARNVDIRIFETGSEPIFRQQISLDREGKPQSFAPKLERGKKYTMVIKSPGTLAKKVEINTGSGGTTIIDPFTVSVGDIYPRNTTDGKVNNLDVSELKRQWSPTKDTQASGDLNSDSRVNNVDYSCMRININKEDETFTPTTASNTGVGATNPLPSTVKIGNKGKVFMDRDLNGVQNEGDQNLANAVVKFLKVPDTHSVGQTLTTVELAASEVLAQATTASDGSFEISVNRIPPLSGNFAFLVDPGSATGSGGELDWKIVAPVNADSIQAWNIPVKP